MNCHILATCRNLDLITSTLMVFKSLRAGFPMANIQVYGNGLADEVACLVSTEAHKNCATFCRINQTSHGAWIESLLHNEREPFWICDTDVEFNDRVQDWFPSPPDSLLFAGRYEPEFFEPWTQSRHMSRLHPSLMWFNPRPLRAAIRTWPGKHPFFSSIEKTLIRWSFVPAQGKLFFYDTCAGLHHALGGQAFDRDQNECFRHTFAGTYSDLLGTTDEDSIKHEEMCKAATIIPLANDGLGDIATP